MRATMTPPRPLQHCFAWVPARSEYAAMTHAWSAGRTDRGALASIRLCAARIPGQYVLLSPERGGVPPRSTAMDEGAGIVWHLDGGGV